MKGMLLVLFTVAGMAYRAGDFLTLRPVIHSLPDRQIAPVSRDDTLDDDVDAYGNEVTPAVAEYSLDPAGEPYELHSPQTELPRLGSPKS